MYILHVSLFIIGILHPIKQPGSYWDRSLAVSLVGDKNTEQRACNGMSNRLTHYAFGDLVNFFNGGNLHTSDVK